MENMRTGCPPRDPLLRFSSAKTHTRLYDEQRAEQGVSGYDPQAAAMHSLSHTAIIYSTARGSSPER